MEKEMASRAFVLLNKIQYCFKFEKCNKKMDLCVQKNYLHILNFELYERTSATSTFRPQFPKKL